VEQKNERTIVLFEIRELDAIGTDALHGFSLPADYSSTAAFCSAKRVADRGGAAEKGEVADAERGIVFHARVVRPSNP